MVTSPRIISVSRNSVAVSAAISSPVFRPRNSSRKCIHGILHSSALIKAQVIGLIVLLGSTLKVLDVVPETVFSDKYNFINQYLAKFSWLWTLLWLLVTVTTTSALYSGLTLSVSLRHLSRVGVSHFMWYSVTSLVDVLYIHLGECSMGSISERHVCIKNGYEWLGGLDISGHVFLLSYCVLVIAEEAANIKLEVWNEFNRTLVAKERKISKRTWLRKWLVNLNSIVGYIIKPLELFGVALVLIWMLMLTSTSLYFHTFLDKVLGYLIAVGAWYCTYGFLYGRHKWLPCEVTYGVRPVRHITN